MKEFLSLGQLKRSAQATGLETDDLSLSSKQNSALTILALFQHCLWSERLISAWRQRIYQGAGSLIKSLASISKGAG